MANGSAARCIRALRRFCSRFLWMALLQLSACGNTIETSVVIERAGSAACTATVDGESRRLDAWIVEAYPALVAGNNGERTCFGINQRLCSVAVRRCGCGDPALPTVEGLRSALSGMRLPDLDAGQYCIRVLALELAQQTFGGGFSREQICSCDDAALDWLVGSLASAQIAWQFQSQLEASAGNPGTGIGGSGSVPLPPPGSPGELAAPPPLYDMSWNEVRSLLRACAVSRAPAPVSEGGQSTLALRCLDDVPEAPSAASAEDGKIAALWRCLGN